MDMIKSGKEQGANLVTGGERIGNKGYFVAPTVFADVKDDMTIAREEVSILKYLIVKKVKKLLKSDVTCLLKNRLNILFIGRYLDRFSRF